jgi:hypothetical protein
MSGRSSEVSSLTTAAACAICSRPVEYLGTDWHHPDASDHPVEVVVWIIPEAGE